jgi:Na+/H+ antiporter NhaD/arsenite permease-like protein
MLETFLLGLPLPANTWLVFVALFIVIRASQALLGRKAGRGESILTLAILAAAMVVNLPLLTARPAVAEGDEVTLTLVGRAVTTAGDPLPETEVRILLDYEEHQIVVDEQPVGSITTGSKGIFVITARLPATQMAEVEAGNVHLVVELSKPGFRQRRVLVAPWEVHRESDEAFVYLPLLALSNLWNAAFYIATITFAAVFVLIAFNVLHDTLTAFLGATVMLGVSYIIGTFHPDFWILGFNRAVDFIDFDAIFLIMTLMILVAIIGSTGIFQWLALMAYRLSRGNAWHLTVILIVITATMSAFLNNVTVMLLIAPVSIEIALLLGIRPTALLIPEVLASNIGGIATLIGDPPNTLIGSFAGLGFNQFLIHMGPMALIASITLIAAVYLIYRRDYRKAPKKPSPVLLARLETDAQITAPTTLRRGLLVMGATVALFFLSDLFKMPPSVVGFIGASALLLWVRPNLEDMVNEVDWTTLLFFMSLFILVGGVQEVGLIQEIAGFTAKVAGGDLFVASQAVVWMSAAASAIVNNIPFTTAALPIAAYLTRTVPGAGNNVLYWSLALGANLGGNATYIGSAPNVVAIGILDRAGHRVTFADWLKVGIPITLVTLFVPAVWLYIRYFWLKF